MVKVSLDKLVGIVSIMQNNGICLRGNKEIRGPPNKVYRSLEKFTLIERNGGEGKVRARAQVPFKLIPL